MRHTLLPSVLSLALLMGFSSCGGGHHTTPPPGSPNSPSNPSTPTAPTTPSFSVTGIAPAAGATGVPLNTSIQITFSSAANASTVNTTDIKVTDPQPVAGTVTYNTMTNTATFAPAAALVANSTYTVTVSGVTSSDGTGLANPYMSSFATVMSSGGGGGTGGGGSGGGGGGSGGGGSGGGGGGGGTVLGAVQYQVTLLASDKNPGGGEVTIDTYGNTIVQLTGALASTKFTVQFCPAYLAEATKATPCIAVSTLTTDAMGNAMQTVKFPTPGSWAGDFELLSGTTSPPAYSTDVEAGNNTEIYESALQPLSLVNGKGAISSLPQDPLSTGILTYSKGSLTVTMTGAAANTAYSAVENILVLGSSSSYLLYNTQHQSEFTTDSRGDVTFTVLQDGLIGDLFEVESNGKSAGFIGGFSIPTR